MPYLLPQHKVPQRQRSISLHATIGVWAAIGLFFLSATGLTWSQFAGGNFSALRQSLDWSTPYLSSEATTTTQVAEEEVPATTQSVFDVARAEGLGDPVAITPSTDGRSMGRLAGAALMAPPGLHGVRPRLRSRSSRACSSPTGRSPESSPKPDLLPHGNPPSAGPTELLLIAIARAIITLIVIGYRMWWRRRPKPPRTGLPTALGRRVDTAAAYGILIAIAAASSASPFPCSEQHSSPSSRSTSPVDCLEHGTARTDESPAVQQRPRGARDDRRSRGKAPVHHASLPLAEQGRAVQPHVAGPVDLLAGRPVCNIERSRALAPWLELYNTRRRHTALGRHPPITRL